MVVLVEPRTVWVGVLVEARTVWWEYWMNPGLCGGSTGLAQDCGWEYWLNPGLWWEYWLKREQWVGVLVEHKTL